MTDHYTKLFSVTELNAIAIPLTHGINDNLSFIGKMAEVSPSESRVILQNIIADIMAGKLISDTGD